MDTIERAFSNISRKNFVPDALIDQAELDTPLPIGYGQTISQPYTVNLMLNWLEAQPGDNVLDVGSGSGWTTALLSEIVGPKGKVYAVEIIPELLEFGKANCEKAKVKNAKFFKAIKEYGLPKYAPYDRILVSASAQSLPVELLSQLKAGGKMVIPVQHDILEITKISENEYETITHPGFVFVPLI